MSREDSKEALLAMATPEFRKEISALIRSRTPLVYLVSTEERRLIQWFFHFAKFGGWNVNLWDCYGGLRDIISNDPSKMIDGNHADPEIVLDAIIKETLQINEAEEIGDNKTNKARARGNVYILLDFHRWLGKTCTADIERRLRTLASMDSNTVVIMVGPSYSSTEALDKDIRVIDFPLPNNNEIKQAVYSAVDSAFKDSNPQVKQEVEKTEQEIINALTGLTYPEVCSAIGKSLVMNQTIKVDTLLKEKQEVIRKTGVLQYIEPEITINDVGGLSVLVDWLQSMKALFHPDAINYGLPVPKGALLIGVPGSGKSLAAKAAATLFQIPLLRLDFGALFGQYLGESERQARLAISIAEKTSPCVLWVDEIDKGLSGHASSGKTDSGVTSRVISTFLTWMQEKKNPVFFMCTANDQSSLPTEFLRAGRFDEIFFVDLPTKYERIDILKKLITRKKRNPDDFDLPMISAKSNGYTGAELEKAIDIALRKGFIESRREIVTQDILNGISSFKPLSHIRQSAIESMQAWAVERCIKANTPDIIPTANIGSNKKIDMGE